MKIWLLTTEYPPFFGGGIATYCVHAGRMLASHGHEVTIFTNDSAIKDRQQIATSDGVRVVRFKPGVSDVYRHLGYVAALSWDFSETIEEFIRSEGKPDVIESQDYLGIAYFLLQKKKTLWPNLGDVPVILTLHTPKFVSDIVAQAPVYRFPEFWIGEMERFTIRAADAIISPSQFLLNELSKHLSLRGVNTWVVRHPFQLDMPNSDESDGNIKATTDGVLFLGRLQYLKGVIQTLNYFQEIWDDGLKVTLKLTGGDTYFHPKNMMMSAYLQKKYNTYFTKGLVTWEGTLPPDKFYERLRRAPVVLMPSLFENFPYVVLESMSLGKVMLASDNGGQKEIIEDGVNGFLFSHGDAGTFKTKLLKILEMPKEETREVGKRARRRVAEMCSYESAYPAKIEVLQRICETKKTVRSFPFIRERKKGESSESHPGYEEKKGLLSIVVPYYNMGDYIKDNLDSLVKVTYPNREIIIVNDGSDDPSSIAMLYQVEKDYPVRVLHKRNAGLASTRNAGARSANGEFLTFLDADDIVAPDYYDWGIRVLDAYDNVSFVGCWTEYFGAQKAIWPAWNPEPPYLLVHNTLSTSSLIFRRRDFVQFGLNDLQMEYGIEDYESLIRMVEHGYSGVVIPKPLFRWRVRPDSLSRGVSRESTLYLYDLLTRKHREFYQEYAIEVFNLLNSNGPAYLYDNPSREFPPVGFVVSERSQVETKIDVSTAGIPSELISNLAQLWQSPQFRRTLKLFFKLRLNKFF